MRPAIYNVAIGDSAAVLTSNFNGTIAIGYHALQHTIPSGTAIGYKALESNTTGVFNVAVGEYALIGNKTGNNNTAVGSYSNSYYWSTGEENTSVGDHSLGFNFAGDKTQQ